MEPDTLSGGAGSVLSEHHDDSDTESQNTGGSKEKCTTHVGAKNNLNVTIDMSANHCYVKVSRFIVRCRFPYPFVPPPTPL